MKNTRKFRVCWSPKKDGEIDFDTVSNKGKWHKSKEFKEPDKNGDEDLEQAWKRACKGLDKKTP